MSTIAVAVAGVVLSAAMVYLGIPAWRLQRHALDAERRSKQTLELGEMLKTLMVGEGGVAPRDPDHPSLSDVLIEIRDNTAEVAWLAAAFGFHLSDGHGGAQLTPPRHHGR